MRLVWQWTQTKYSYSLLFSYMFIEVWSTIKKKRKRLYNTKYCVTEATRIVLTLTNLRILHEVVRIVIIYESTCVVLFFGNMVQKTVKLNFLKGFFFFSVDCLQIEGACKDGSRGASIWDAFTHTEGLQLIFHKILKIIHIYIYIYIFFLFNISEASCRIDLSCFNPYGQFWHWSWLSNLVCFLFHFPRKNYWQKQWWCCSGSLSSIQGQY